VQSYQGRFEERVGRSLDDYVRRGSLDDDDSAPS
jgi:hypothetical protein